MTPRSRLHVPSPPARPGQEPDFSYVQISPAGAVPRPDVTATAREIEDLSVEMVRVLGEDHRARRSLEPAPRAGRAAGRPAPHGADAPLRRPHAAHPAPGPHLLLYQVDGRGGGGGRGRHGAAAGRHAVSLLPPAGPARGARPAAGGSDVPVPVQYPRHVQGPADAHHVPLGQGQHLLDLRQPRDAVSAGGRLGDGGGHQGRGPPRGQLDRRGLERRSRLPLRHDLRRGVPRAGHSQPGQQSVGHLHLPGVRRRRAQHLRAARPRLWHPGAARRRQRLPRRVRGHAVGGAARAPERRPDAHRAGHLPRLGALHQRRSLALPSQGRVPRLAARRSDHAPQAAPDRARRVVGAASRPAREGARGARHRQLEGGGVATAPSPAVRHSTRSPCSRTCSRTCRRTWCASARSCGVCASRRPTPRMRRRLPPRRAEPWRA